MRDGVRHQRSGCLHRCLPASGVHCSAPGAGLERQLPHTLQQRVPAGAAVTGLFLSAESLIALLPLFSVPVYPARLLHTDSYLLHCL